MNKSEEQIIELLAQQMYWKFEQIAPGLEDYVPWEELPDIDRDTYRSVVRDLSRYPEEWKWLDEHREDRSDGS